MGIVWARASYRSREPIGWRLEDVVEAQAGLVIRGATVVDGTGRPPLQADVAIEGAHIVAVGREAKARDVGRVLDGAGLVVAPGFIDMHSHADFTLPTYPGALNSLSQGVTTEVVGNCGYSPAPLANDPGRAEEQRAACHGLGPDLDWDWRSFGEFLEVLQAARPSVNCVPLVGHGMLRLAVVGADDRTATAEERVEMRRLLADALAAGAWGMSTGLVYPPGSYASTDEIVDVGGALTARDGLYASHIRDETDGLMSALSEAVEIGRRLGVRVEVSHLKAAGSSNHGRAADALALLGEARSAGARVTQDAYPYTAGSTLLSQLLPPWVHDGGTDALVERLRSDEMRARIMVDIETGLQGWPNFYRSTGGPHAIRIAAVAERSLARLEGLVLTDAAAVAGTDPLTFVFDTLVADRGATTMILSMMSDADVDAILDDPSTSIGSDQLGVTSADARVHPRAYGTFVRMLGRWVRERRRMDLPTAIHRMTVLPARILGLEDRGRIAPGHVADLVMFDPETVGDASTYEAPTLPARGVETVLLRGRFAVDGGRPIDVGLGQVLRRPISERPPTHRSR
jgi:N-acyl-D-aspartate/D-glutamate deacylase